MKHWQTTQDGSRRIAAEVHHRTDTAVSIFTKEKWKQPSKVNIGRSFFHLFLDSIVVSQIGHAARHSNDAIILVLLLLDALGQSFSRVLEN